MAHDEAVIYVRASKDRTGAGVTIGTQETECRPVAASRGQKIRHVYADNDISAAQRKKPRKAYEQMLADLKRDPADVIVWHPDRLHRQPAELERYIDLVEPRGILTFSAQAAPIDLATSSGRLVARILGAAAAHEVEVMSDRHEAAKRRNAAAGRPIGMPRAFGYAADGMTLCHGEIIMTAAEAGRRHLRPLRKVTTIRGPRVAVKLPYDEAAELQSAITAVLGGASLHSVARDWNTRGVRTSRGGQWDTTAVRRVLTRARNAGLMEHKGVMVGPAAWPGVTDELTLHRVRGVLSRPARPGTRSSVALGTGIYRCACGLTMRLLSPVTYRCSIDRIPQERTQPHASRNVAALDGYVEAHLRAWLGLAGNVAKLTAAAPDLSGTEKELAEVRAEMDEHAAAAAARRITPRQLAIVSAGLLERAEELEARLEAAGWPDITGGAEMTGEDLWELVKGDLDRKRALLQRVLAVRVLPQPKGRPAGWRAGMPYFDANYIEISRKL